MSGDWQKDDDYADWIKRGCPGVTETQPVPEPGIPDEAVEAAITAFEHRSRRPCKVTEAFHAALAAAYPSLRAAIEADVRERVASEIAARSIGAESVARGQTFAMNEFDRGLGVAAAVARGVCATGPQCNGSWLTCEKHGPVSSGGDS